MHRDTRLHELIGDTVIQRQPMQGGEGELIQASLRRAGLLGSEFAILDDLSRAPGEALNVLLRILNERRYGGERIPLLTAVATGNETATGIYTNEAVGLVGRDVLHSSLRFGCAKMREISDILLM